MWFACWSFVFPSASVSTEPVQLAEHIEARSFCPSIPCSVRSPDCGSVCLSVRPFPHLQVVITQHTHTHTTADERARHFPFSSTERPDSGHSRQTLIPFPLGLDRSRMATFAHCADRFRTARGHMYAMDRPTVQCRISIHSFPHGRYAALSSTSLHTSARRRSQRRISHFLYGRERSPVRRHGQPWISSPPRFCMLGAFDAFAALTAAPSVSLYTGSGSAQVVGQTPRLNGNVVSILTAAPPRMRATH